MSAFVLQADNLHFTYRSKGESLNILNGLSLSIAAGETVAIVGASGSGKSTLLHLLAGLDTPDSGSITLCGENFVQAGKAQHNRRSKMRNRYMGFVYQFHHLLAEFTAQENVAMPLRIRGLSDKEAMRQAALWLEKVGLAARMRHKPAELSGGERQRAAIARALVTQPQCLLADEPTGNLDNANASAVFALMQELVREQQGAMILVTHDMHIAQQTQTCYYLQQGILQRQNPTHVSGD